MRELTFRGVMLGGLITLLFTAANVYLGLKVGLTFATSIPAAVISMALLRFFKDATILENNIVQTIASAAGTLAAIIFVLPGLVMIGWWTGFPYVTTALITMTGGILGVMFSVPLRRALVIDTDLPYPEGRAAAEVLEIGSGSRAGAEENARGLWVLVWNSLASAGFAILTQMKLAVAEAATWFRAGAGATGISGGLSFALFGVGHLVGLSVGLAQMVGLVVGWWILLPILTAQQPISGDVETWANTVFRNDVRFFGAGVIGVAAIWALIRIAGPVVGGIRSAMAASRARGGGAVLALEERDMPIGIVAGASLALLIPIAWLLWSVISGGPLAGSAISLIGGALLFVVVIGLMIAAVCGYMAADRCIEQSRLGDRHSFGAGRIADAGWVVRTRCQPRYDTGAYRLFPDRHRDCLRSGDDFQRQSAGFENRPTGRSDAVEAAGCAGDRRRVRLACRSARARSAQHRLWVCRRAQCRAQCPFRTTSRIDLFVGQGRSGRQSQLADDRLWHCSRRWLCHSR